MGRQQSEKTYTIQETARLTGLPSSTLRYYESIGIIEPIARDSSSKHRAYSEENLNTLTVIACLNATGMGIEDMRTYLANHANGSAGADIEISLLTDQKQRLTDEAKLLKVRQSYVDAKIAYWQAVKADNSVDLAGAKCHADMLITKLVVKNKGVYESSNLQGAESN